jgi:hypothetical protein
MTYFKIGENDYSAYVNELKVRSSATYRAQTNAAGNTVVDNTHRKREISVGIIPLDDTAMKNLMEDVEAFQVSIEFLNPETNEMEFTYCIIPDYEVEYYTIRVGNVKYKAFNLTFIEL